MRRSVRIPSAEVLAALRGPDCGDAYGLKWLFTARVRGFVAKAYKIQPVGIVEQDPPSLNTLSEMIKRAVTEWQQWHRRDPRGVQHYLAHVKCALTELHHAARWEETDRLLLTALQRLAFYLLNEDVTKAMRVFREILSQHRRDK